MTSSGDEGPSDTIVRAMTDDGAFRVITARTTNMVRGAVASQQARGATAERFGDLLTGAVLYRETMAPRLRVQGILQGAGGRGRLVADAHPDGATRGLVTLAEGASAFELGGGAQLVMMRSLPSGAMHRGVVAVPESGAISDALMACMQSSEQVASMIAVATVMDDEGAVQSAGGYILQLLPEVGEGPLMLMSERLRDFERIHELVRQPTYTPDALIDELLYGMPYTRLEERSVRFACQCSDVRVVATLASLPRADIEELVEGGEVLEIGCDYCGKQYQVHPAQLRGLLESS